MIALVQTNPVQGNITANLERAGRLIEGIGDVDLIVLPEMFSSGQYIDPTGIAETMDGVTVSWMTQQAAKANAAVLGSVAIVENGLYYNRLCMAMPDGSVHKYDKHHLFRYSGEGDHFAAGLKRVIVEFRGIRYLLMVCYDLRYPIFSRNRGDYDVAIYVANWPDVRISSWDILLRARAIENQAYVIGVNRCGSDEFGEYPGHSMLIHPYGHTLAQCPDSAESVTTCRIDMKFLDHYRSVFPVLPDADLPATADYL